MLAAAQPGRPVTCTPSWYHACEKFLDKFVVKRILKLPPHLAYAATLPHETLMSAKQAVNDKLQGSVATYLKCNGAVNKQIGKGLLLSL